ncbi:putative DNA-binding protein [Caldicellulosiruptoraceae bacterium PP1]
MDKKIYISLLIDFYKNLLTPKQKTIIELYINEDLSISEISENLGISRQGVHDFVKKAEEQLIQYENVLHLVERYLNQKRYIDEILEDLNKIYNKYFDNEILIIINKIQEMAKNGI